MLRVLRVVPAALVAMAAVLGVAGPATADWTWTGLPLPESGTGLAGLGAAATADGTAVVWSGFSDGPLGSTWTHDGTTWEPICGTGAPSDPGACPQGPRVGTGLGAGPTGVVMFGGQDTGFGTPGTAFGDTWRFTGTGWSELCDTDGCGPGARSGHAMAGNGTVVVLQGGQGGAPLHDDTWVFDGTDWTRICGGPLPACGPGSRAGATLVWDGSVFVLFGGVGFDGDFVESAATWTFDPDTLTWTAICGDPLPACGPPHRSFAAAAPLGTGPGAVLAGGMLLGPDGETLPDVWQWDGSTWTELARPWPDTRLPTGAPLEGCAVWPMHAWTGPDGVALTLLVGGTAAPGGGSLAVGGEDLDFPALGDPCVAPSAPDPDDPGDGDPGADPPSGDDGSGGDPGPGGDDGEGSDPSGDDPQGGSELPRTGARGALLGAGLGLAGVGLALLRATRAAQGYLR